MTHLPLYMPEIPFPPFIQKSLTQQLEMLALETSQRTINGTLITHPWPSKYRLTVRGSMKHTPCLERVSIGQQVTVHLSQHLWSHTIEDVFTCKYRPRPKSILILNELGKAVTMNTQEAQTIRFENQKKDMRYIGYCPIISMQVQHMQTTDESKEHTQTWRLVLEEI